MAPQLRTADSLIFEANHSGNLALGEENEE